MAQAQVIISAVDRTQVAINSALRGMRSIDRTAKTITRSMNLAFAVLSGTAFTASFNKIAEATAKTSKGAEQFTGELQRMKTGFAALTAAKSGVPAATDAMVKLNETLRDPQLIAAADAITSALLIGFTKAANKVLELGKNIRQALVVTGAATAVTPEEKISVLEEELRGLIGGGGISMGMRNARLGELTEAEKKRVKEIRDQINALQLDRLTEVQIESRKVQTPGTDLNAYFNKVLPEIIIQSSKKTATAMEKLYSDLRSKIMTASEKEAQEYAEFEAALLGLEYDPAEVERRLAERFLTGVEVTGKKVKEVETVMTQFAATAAQNMQNAFAQFLFDPFEDGLKGMLANFVNMLRQMVAQIIAQQILLVFFRWLGGSDISWLANFSKAAAGSIENKAIGGPVSQGTPYIVGERGPELFVPNSSGSIVPNNRMGGMTVAPVYNIDARGATADLQQALPGILKENNRRIFDELDRRYGIGR